MILVHPDRFDALLEFQDALMKGGHVKEGMRIVCADVPKEDEHGRPVLAFLFDVSRIWAWTGEPIPMSPQD